MSSHGNSPPVLGNHPAFRSGRPRQGVARPIALNDPRCFPAVARLDGPSFRSREIIRAPVLLENSVLSASGFQDVVYSPTFTINVWSRTREPARNRTLPWTHAVVGRQGCVR